MQLPCELHFHCVPCVGVATFCFIKLGRLNPVPAKLLVLLVRTASVCLCSHVMHWSCVSIGSEAVLCCPVLLC